VLVYNRDPLSGLILKVGGLMLSGRGVKSL